MVGHQNFGRCKIKSHTTVFKFLSNESFTKYAITELQFEEVGDKLLEN